MASIVNENTQYTDELTGELIVNGYIYIGDQNQDPVLNPKDIFSDRDLTVVLTNPQRTDSDGRSVNKIWTNGRYSIKTEDENNVQKLLDSDVGEAGQTGISTLTNIQGIDTITANGSPTITALGDQEIFTFRAIGTVTGAVTLQIDTTAAWPVKKYHDQALVAGDWEINQVVSVMWNETDSVYELQSSTAGHNYPTPISVTDGTDSTSGSTGSINTAGGIGAVKDIVTDANFKPLGDTAVADKAAVGYTATQGLILTGQGLTSDVSIKNDADSAVASVPTGTKTLLLDGGQLAFPASQNASADANTLDDYEEGTWTVTLSGPGGSDSSTTTTGSYTKIGDMVTASFSSLNDISTAGLTSGDLRITLPFTSGGAGGAGAIVTNDINFTAAATIVTPIATSAAGYAELRETADDAANTTIQISDLTTGASDIVRFTITYMV